MFKVMILSGGFDPLHRGHIQMFKDAARKVNKDGLIDAGHVAVALNSDAWLVKKKGIAFMGFEERKEILQACRFTNFVVGFEDDGDGTAIDGIRSIVDWYKRNDYRQDMHFIFGNGGDRRADTTPTFEQDYCREHGIEVMFGLGGLKQQASSDLLRRYGDWYHNSIRHRQIDTLQKPMFVLDDTPVTSER